MCYITESAIDHDNDRAGRLTCENCQGDYNKLIEIEYCLAAEANEWVCKHCRLIFSYSFSISYVITAIYFSYNVWKYRNCIYICTIN